MNTYKTNFKAEIQSDTYREVFYMLLVRKEAIKASHLRLYRKLKSSVWH